MRMTERQARIRLGHASLDTTHKYLHTLRELEMRTRLALVPDVWEHPDRQYLADMAEKVQADECRSLDDAWGDDDLVTDELA